MKFLTYAIVLFLTLSVVTTGCSSKKEAVDNQETSITETSEKEEILEETETSIDYNENEDEDKEPIVIANRDAQWPNDIPSFFPKLKGHIVGVIEDTEDGLTKYSVMYDKINTSEMDDFEKRMESKPGWTITTQMQTEVRWIIMATNEKQNAELSVIATIGKVEGDGLGGGMTIKFKK